MQSLRTPTRFHSSILSVFSAMLLMLGINGLVLALRGPGTYLAELLVNWIIRREHFDVLYLGEDKILWFQFVPNLAFLLIILTLGIMVAYWAYGKRKPGAPTLSSSKIEM